MKTLTTLTGTLVGLSAKSLSVLLSGQTAPTVWSFNQIGLTSDYTIGSAVTIALTIPENATEESLPGTTWGKIVNFSPVLDSSGNVSSVDSSGTVKSVIVGVDFQNCSTIVSFVSDLATFKAYVDYNGNPLTIGSSLNLAVTS